MSESTATLLAELDGLAYRDRMRTLARRAREHAAAGTLAGTVAALRGRGRYERFLAVTMGVVAGDADVVRPALADSDGWVRATALKACLRRGWIAAPELAALVADAPLDLRRLVYRRIRAGRPELADALIEAVHARFGDDEAAWLLPACTGSTVERLLPQLDHVVERSRALAHRHPDIVLSHAERVLGGLDPTSRADWWAYRATGVLSLVADAPDRVLDLLERVGPATRLPGDLHGYGVLAAADARRVARLLAAPARAPWLRHTRVPSALLDRLGRLDVPDLVELGRRLRGNDQAWAALLRAVPPARRGDLYDQVTADTETAQALVGEPVLDVLPWRWQEREARRMLGLPRVRRDEAAVLRYTTYLPWDEAMPVLVAATRRADADDRATAYELLVSAARRSGDPAAVADVVERLGRLRNEQDPVRARALAALGRLVPLLRPDSVGTLTTLVTDATAARDASSLTLAALTRAAAETVQYHAADPALLAWALSTLDRIMAGHRVPALGRLDRALRRGQEAEVFARMRPWAEAGMARGQFDALFAVAYAFGRRAWRLPELQALLRRAISPRTVSTAFRTAVALWLDDPATRADRVAEVLRVDPSTVVLDVVWQTLCARRTDLLDVALTGPAPAGKLLTAGVRWVPRGARYVERWLPRHRDAFVGLLARIAGDAGATQADRAAAIAAAGPVPEAGRALVDRYVDSLDTRLAEAALGALAWTDRPEDALPVLLAHASGDRARVAVYAAARTARFIAPTSLFDVLAPVATGRGKVTGRKEAVRLLGRYGTPAAGALLAEVWRQEGQHRDVRAAVVTAARLRLDLPASWPILGEAATGSREEALALLAMPLTAVAERDRRRYAALVVRACTSADPVVARTAWATVPRWAYWADDLTDRVVSAVSDVDDRLGWPAVAAAIVALLGHEGHATGNPLWAALAALVRLDTADPDPGGPAGDRPARRRIESLARTVADWAGRAGPDLDRTPVRAAARALAGTPEFVPQAAWLLVHLATPDAPGPDEFVEVAALAADRPALAARLADALADRVDRADGTWRAAGVARTAGALADRPDTASGLFAVALAGLGERYRWTARWQALVHGLRRHPVADVRAAALELFMGAADQAPRR